MSDPIEQPGPEMGNSAQPSTSDESADARFRLPLRESYVVPAHCSSCDADVGEDAYSYPLYLERISKGDKSGPTLWLPLCAHCRRRRSWDRAGALIGILFGGLALVVLYPALRQAYVLLAVIAAVVLFFGTAVGFSILWIRVADWIVGRPRFESVLFSRPRGADYVAFVFHNQVYGERFRRANATPETEPDDVS